MKMVSGSEKESWMTEKPDVILLCRQCDRFMEYTGESFRNCHEYRCPSCGQITRVFNTEIVKEEHYHDMYVRAKLEGAC